MTRPTVKQLIDGLPPSSFQHGGWSNEQIDALARVCIAVVMSNPLALTKTAFRPNRLAVAMGFRTRGKAGRRYRSTPYSAVVLSLLASLSDCRRPISAITEHSDGAEIEAELGAHILAYAGSMVFKVIDHPRKGVKIQGSSLIKGQLLDFGRGRRAVEEVLVGVDRRLL